MHSWTPLRALLTRNGRQGDAFVLPVGGSERNLDDRVHADLIRSIGAGVAVRMTSYLHAAATD